jgi:hypothetical protein
MSWKWNAKFNKMISHICPEYRKKFKNVISHLNSAKDMSQIANSYEMFCKKIGKKRIHQTTGFKFIYLLLKPNVYGNYNNEYCLRVQYDYIKMHNDYEKYGDNPYHILDYSHFNNLYGKGIHLKFYKHLNVTMFIKDENKPVATFYNQTVEFYTIQKYIDCVSTNLKDALQISIQKIYSQRKKEFYENELLLLAYKIRIQKKIRLNLSNINAILKYM